MFYYILILNLTKLTPSSTDLNSTTPKLYQGKPQYHLVLVIFALTKFKPSATHLNSILFGTWRPIPTTVTAISQLKFLYHPALIFDCHKLQ